ncbi:MAG: PKD domain-containing protein [Bacteroidota bacterium]
MEVNHTLIKLILPKLFLLLVFSFTGQVNVQGQCSANAAFNGSLTACSTVQFSDLSSAAQNYTIVAWDWDFGDGNTSTLQNPLHVYAPGSTYIVQLTVTADSSGVTCTDVGTGVMTIPALPTVYFTWDPDPTCLGGATSFFGTSGKPIVMWNWDFGDGQTSTIQNPVHLYPLAGAYTVTLIVTDVDGCSDTAINTVDVGDIPDVDFTFNPDPTCLNSVTNFYGTSTVASTVTSWSWDFGDGGIGFTQDAIHTYLSAGTYTVILSIQDTNGCTNSISYPVTVNQLPTANFFHDGPTCLNDSVHFTNISTTPNGYITTWEWDFGDGTSTTVTFPDDPNVVHSYPNTGTFQVTLTITDSDDCSDFTFRDVNIVANPAADFTFTSACNQQPVDFTDLSSPNGGNSLVSWYWEFGDPGSGINNTSTLQHPSHIFTSDGTYSVIMVVSNTDGCTDSITYDVTVSALPDVQITTDSDTICVNAIANFYGSGSASLVTWLWAFGDGGTSILQNPQYSYASPGTYTVTLTGTDVNGCDSTATHTMTVNPPPSADFNTSSPACEGFPMDFFDISSSPNGWITEWHWYFGDGTDTVVLFPDPPNVTHTYTLSGSYIASLVITSNAGCTDSITHEVTISVSPQSEFSAGGPRCEGNLIQFFDESMGFGTGIQAWSWNFDDPSSGSNNTSTLQNPYHLFSNAGTYNVFLEVTNANGCIDSISHDIEIYPPPPVYFNISPSGGVCQNDTAYFSVNTDTTDISAVISFFWDFGDPASGTQDTSSLMNPWHIFTTFGSFNVTLTITDTSGCINSIILPVEVLEIPTADYTFIQACFNDSTMFTDQSLPGATVINQWFWKFNDPGYAPGDTSNLQNTGHMFSAIDNYFVELTVTDNNGCSATAGKWVEVFDTPNAGFSFQQYCDPPGSVQFIDESSFGSSGSPLQSWNWELDEGYFSNEINPAYIYDILDTCYIINLTVTDNNLCSDTYTDTICLFGEASVDFTAEQVCFRERTLFQGLPLTSDSIAGWYWDFGDGSPIYATPHDTVSHYYNAPGDYLVTLNATDINGCEASTYQMVRVDSLPTPNFVTDTAHCDSPTSFYDLSVGNGTFIQSWEWNFGDINSGSNTSTAQSPQHLYSGNDSTYFVSLKVSNYLGCYDSIMLPVYKGPCVLASFEAIDPPFCNNQNVCFANTSQFFGSTGNINEWIFDYGDGNSDIFTSSPDTICHVFADPGTYQIQFIINANVSGNNYSDTAYLTIEVSPTPTADFMTYLNCTNEETYFEDRSEGNGANVVGWEWDFGDLTATNDTSSLEHPSYQYPSAGLYDVQQIVTSDNGCIDTLDLQVEVFDPPIAEFSSATGCQEEMTDFFDETEVSGPDIYSWHWSFGDSQSMNDTSVLQNPSHQYDDLGTYFVTLIVEDLNQCRDTIIKDIEVFEVPTSGFNLIENYQSTQGVVLLDNISIGADFYEWDFGNGETSIEFSPVTTYTEDGTYLIQLIAYNEYGCPDTTLMEYELLFKGLFIPSAFRPGGSVENRRWKPVGINMKRYKVEVYTLWGNLVFSSTLLNKDGQPRETWRGTLNNESSGLLPPGNYIWKASATFRDDTLWKGMDDGDGNLRTSGVITLIR